MNAPTSTRPSRSTRARQRTDRPADTPVAGAPTSEPASITSIGPHSPRPNERLLNTVVNLVYTRPSTAEDLARCLRVSVVTVKTALEHLMSQQRVYDTRSRRKTSYHAVVLRGVTTPATRDGEARSAALRAVLARAPHKKYTAADLSRITGEPQDEVATLLNSGILAGWVVFVNIGALRVYGLHPDQRS